MGLLAFVLQFAFAWPVPAGAQSVKYIPGEGPAGGSAAVLVSGAALAHTAQILPTDASGSMAGLGDVDEQIEKVFENLSHALTAAGSKLRRVVRLNVVVRTIDVVRPLEQAIARRFPEHARPAVSLVQGALRHPNAFLAVDAVATTSLQPGLGRVLWRRSASLTGMAGTSHVAILPDGPRVYVSGRAGDGDLSEATSDALKKLKEVLDFLELDLSHVVQVKGFLKPMSDVSLAERRTVEFFGGKAPPLVFVEWQNTKAIEMEWIAAVPEGGHGDRHSIEFLTPPGMSVSPVFSRLTRVFHPDTIYISSLNGRTFGRGVLQVREMFASLDKILREAGSDLHHLVKATYYVSDDFTSRKLNEIRPEFYDPKRPPAASKASVEGTAVLGRSLAVDMIAVPGE